MALVGPRKRGVCGLCTTEADLRSGRCLECDSLKGRILRSTERLGIVEDWSEVSTEKKKEWFKENHGKCGDELDTSLILCITEKLTETEKKS